MPEKVTGYQYRTTIVCVDSYRDKILSGRISNPYLGGMAPFSSLMQFILQMANLLDGMNFPQSFAENRVFVPVEQRTTRVDTEEAAPEGKLATFAVKILFRQNASWQGSITWLDTGQEESFRSVLELILLMDSALQSGG